MVFSVDLFLLKVLILLGPGQQSDGHLVNQNVSRL